MSRRYDFKRGGIVALVALLVVLAGVPSVVAAQDTRASGTVVVEEGETVGDLTVLSGTVIVRGTVDGDLTALSGTVRVDGTVTGDVSAAAGTVQIRGTVGGDVSVASGTVSVEEGAAIGSLSVGSGDVSIDGTVRGDANIGASTISLGETAVVEGDLRYDGDLVRADGAVVQGEVVRENFGFAFAPFGLSIPWWLLAIYGFMANVLLGAVLLLAFPGATDRVAETVAAEPVRAGLVGLLTVVAVPVALVLVALTLIGIPLTIMGAFAFVFVVWVAAVLGRYAVGAWLLAKADVDNRWAALLTGVVLLAVLTRVPILGGVFEAIVSLLGLGALALFLRDAYRARRATPTPAYGEGMEGEGIAGGDDGEGGDTPTA